MTLRIEIEDGEESIACVLIGIDKGKYLIFRTPPLHALDNASCPLNKEKDIYVKYVYKGTIFGFQSKVIDSIYEPFRLLFIEYPEKIESYDFRGNKRVECYLPAFIRIADRRIEGSITDISKAGCLYEIKIPEFEKCEKLFESNKEIDMVFQLPGIKEALSANAKQRSTKTDRSKVSIGIEFVYMESRDKAKLFDFLSKANT